MALINKICFEDKCGQIIETYTKTEIDALIANLTGVRFEVVATRPATGASGTIYLVGNDDDGYEQWVYANDTWINLGSTSIDLSNYVTNNDLTTATASFFNGATYTASNRNLTFTRGDDTTQTVTLPVATTSTAGLMSAAQAVLVNKSAGANSYPVGSNVKHIYAATGGVLTASTATVGTTTTPVYLSSGTMTAGSEYVPRSGGNFIGSLRVGQLESYDGTRYLHVGPLQTGNGAIRIYNEGIYGGILTLAGSGNTGTGLKTNRNYFLEDLVNGNAYFATLSAYASDSSTTSHTYRKLYIANRIRSSDSSTKMLKSALSCKTGMNSATNVIKYGLLLEGDTDDESLYYGGDVGIFADTSKVIWHFSPMTNANSSSSSTDLGNASRRWRNCYLVNNPNVSSDRNDKREIDDLSERYDELFTKLKPRQYKRDAQDAERIHLGFIAQELEEELVECGMTNIDFAAICKDYEPELERDVYSIRYEQFIPMIVSVVQKQEKRIKELEDLLL